MFTSSSTAARLRNLANIPKSKKRDLSHSCSLPHGRTHFMLQASSVTSKGQQDCVSDDDDSDDFFLPALRARPTTKVAGKVISCSFQTVGTADNLYIDSVDPEVTIIGALCTRKIIT